MMKPTAGANPFSDRSGIKAARIPVFAVLKRAFAPGKEGKFALRRLAASVKIDSNRLWRVSTGELNLEKREIERIRALLKKERRQVGPLLQKKIETINLELLGRPNAPQAKSSKTAEAREEKGGKPKEAPQLLKASSVEKASLLRALAGSGIFADGPPLLTEVRPGLVVLMRNGGSLEVRTNGQASSLIATLP